MRASSRVGKWTAAVAGLVVTGAAHATFPGANSQIAWTSVVDPDTQAARTAIFVDTAPITYPLPDENHFDPSWSPDGSKLVFVSKSPQGEYKIERINADGTGRQVVVNTTQLGFVHPPRFPVWHRDGTRIVFTCKGDTWNFLYWVEANGSLSQPTTSEYLVSAEIDTSSRGPVIYKPWGALGFGMFALPGGGDPGGSLPITIPNAEPGATFSSPVWMPDGKTLVFLALYSIMENGQPVTRQEWFKIRRDGTGVEQLTKAEDICPSPGLQPDFSFSSFDAAPGAAPSPDGEIVVFRGAKISVDKYENGNCTFSSMNGLWAIRTSRAPGAPAGTASGGRPRLVHEDKNARGRPSWRTIGSGGLVVNIDDGRLNPLQGLKVEIFDAITGVAPPNATASNTIGGSYAFNNVGYGTYRVRATLLESLPGGISAFDVRHAEGADEPVWLEKTVVHAWGMPAPRFAFDLTAGASNVPEPLRDSLEDMANIYYRTKQYVDWLRVSLESDFGETVPVVAYATATPDGSPVTSGGCSYNREHRLISIGVAASAYENRDGSAEANGPENCEWHEFTHHVFQRFVESDDPGPCLGGSHAGYRNLTTCNSVLEGFAEFLPTLAAQAIDGASDTVYDGRFGSIEYNWKAWDSNPNSGSQKEDFAVAGLFWDLLDTHADARTTDVIGSDGAHHVVAYQDNVSMPLAEIWNMLKSLGPIQATVAEIRLAFGTVTPTRDLDGIPPADVAPIDEVFLMHGFHPVQGDQVRTPTHTSYHFNVSQADQIGLTTHDELDAAGNITSVGSLRESVGSDPGANIEVSVQDASGTPLAGASVRLTIDDVTPSRTNERGLGAGVAVRVGLDLPSYFSYVLPSDAPGPPPCDPVHDNVVNVVLTATINGFDSTGGFTFDNCAYWHAVAASAGTTAMSFSFSFPEDATPPLSAIHAEVSDAGAWILELSCDDPTSGGFASGCLRTEYRVDGGPLTPYTRSIVLLDPGPHLVEFRSIDGAANEEAFQSANYNVLAPQDSDGDTLSDAHEAAIGTNPNAADTDGDGLRDDAELTRGTNPLVGDTDGDGLDDGAEVAAGTNPLAADTDGDGLSDGAEVAAGLNPLLADTDGDSRSDGADNCPATANPAQGDADGDGRGELCDNCPGVANASQADGDLDGAGDACDCASSNASVRAPAALGLEVAKSGGSTIVLSWSAAVGADDYNVTVGTRAGLVTGDLGACDGSTGGALSFQSAQLPAPGQLLTYLVQGQSYACGMGSLGFGVGDAARVNANPAACHAATVVDRRTASGTLVFGSASGSHTDTHVAEGVALVVDETLSSGGSPSTRFSRLEHRFTIDVAPAPQIQLIVKGTRTSSTDGDDFRFEWSTDGTTFTPVSMTSLPTVDDGTLRSGVLPPSLSGIVTLRVVDTDRTAGHQTFDTVRIDSLLVRSITP